MDFSKFFVLRVITVTTALIALSCILIYSPSTTNNLSHRADVLAVNSGHWKDLSLLKIHNTLIKRRMPKCLIVGFAKCGTYALKSFLSLHPSIVCAENETQFFSRFYHKGFDWYKQQMPLSSEHQITLEKTPSYVESKLALRRIHAFNSSMKLIVIVRNPVIRLQSSYAHFMSKNKNRKMNITFKEWCGDNKSIAQRMDLSSYFVDIYSLFRRDQVLVLSEEDLEVDPLRVMQEVETFIGLNHSFTKGIFVFNFKKGFFCFNTSNSKFRDISSEIKVDPITGCLNKNKGRSHPNVDRIFLKKLSLLALPLKEKLFRVTHKRFHWPKIEPL